MTELTDEQLLDLINSVLKKRMQGDAYSSYTVQQRQFAGDSNEKLMQMRRELKRDIATNNGGGFSLMEPFCD